MKPTMKLRQSDLEEIVTQEAIRFFAYPDPGSPLAVATKGVKKVRWGFAPARTLLASLPPEVAKLDGSPWTCGVGHTRGVTMDTTCNREIAMQWLDEDLDRHQVNVEQAVTGPINADIYFALVDFDFNTGQLRSSKLLKKHNAGDYIGAAEEFPKWNGVINKQTGVKTVLAGLVKRRAVEKAIYLRGVEALTHAEQGGTRTTHIAEPAPKKVSKTLIGTGTAGVGALGASLSEAAGHFQPLVEYSEMIKWAFLILTVGGIVLAHWAKMKDRSEEKG